MADTKTELFDLYDVNRKPLNLTMQRGTKTPDGTCRLVVHVCVFSPDGKMLCQHRQPFKKGWSNMWDISAGGSVTSGEDSQQGARRETLEELGITLPEKLLPSLTVHFDGGFDDYYCVVMDVDEQSCVLQQEEVAEVKWFSESEICRMIDDSTFVPFSKDLIRLLFFMRHNRTALTRQEKIIW